MSGGYQVLREVNLLGKQRQRGDTVTAEEAAKVPPLNLSVLVDGVDAYLRPEDASALTVEQQDEVSVIVSAHIEAILPGLRDSVVAALKGKTLSPYAIKTSSTNGPAKKAAAKKPAAKKPAGSAKK